MSLEYLKKATGNSFKSKSKSTQSHSLDQAQFLLAKSGSSTGTPPPTPGSKRLTGSSSLDTPLRPTSDGPKSGHRTVAAMTPLLEAEIKGTTQHVDPGFFNRVVKKRARRTGIDDISIAQFIQNSGLYNSDAKQWNNITKTTVEKDLYPHFLKIFQQVVATFHVKEREVIATFNIKIKHIEGSLGDSKLKTSPDLFFYGSGPNFHPKGLQLELKDKADYRYCASPCEIKTEHNLSEEGVVTQVGVYARQCFIQQGNRHYVYSLVMTEKRVFLLQFDRNGILRGEYVDIHENPVDFVYLILLVSSPNCTTLGFDTSVYWRGDKRYIKTLNEDGKRVEYEIINSEPFFQRRTIRGRGTLCWLGRDPRGILRIIKDSWQAQGRNPEADLLEELKGVPGVGQMIAFEPEKLTIAGLRGMNDKALPSGMVDRLFRRIVLKAYGNQIEDFANPKQFLYAFRDAVAGHKSMWDMNIIHRDISVNNILIGEEGAEEGWRGVVIDMDMAVRWQREHTMAAVDFRTGTRAFQALLVIGSEQDKAKGVVILPHDHMDDLESFFYVFSWVCMGRNQYGQPVKCAVLEHWEGDDLQDVFVHKENFLVSKSVNPKHDEVIHNFGPIFQNLFDGLRVLGQNTEDSC
ncbi:hypothetical protein NLJ89_g11477 [Agrocybe chaxingu]|uniref:Fungal-type protein kinase domain-containing protein n=1 Tax=Agrocybe chaxingu TaxID=84603 RepID=A0A9W8JNN2_9AGAR|nr:hypothetical protein NLJ89_g11477 [Agrocybe chaxingu]